MKVTKLTKQQVIDFINSQPDERPIDFTEPNYSPGDCGCLLVHLNQNVTSNYTDSIHCSFSDASNYEKNWWVKTEVSVDCFLKENSRSLMEGGAGIKNYGELKKLTHLL